MVASVLDDGGEFVRARESYAAIVARLAAPTREHMKQAVAEGAVPPKLGVSGHAGIWVWVVLLGADLAYELAAFADGKGGAPTLSQLVKRARRAGGVAGSVILVIVLAVAYVVLNLHWVLEWPG